MSVYVDNYRAAFSNMTMCHMAADTSEELLAMADAIGVQRKWIQAPNTPKEHFDICLSKRVLAVRHGALEVDVRFIAELVGKKRAAATEISTTKKEPLVSGGGCRCRRPYPIR